MSARAMWKAVIRLGDERVPVKLYAAVQDRRVHFRLLHRSDHAPVRQAMVDPHSGDVVSRSDALRAAETDDGDVVLLREDELSDIEPEPSRDIHVLRALPPAAIDHRWYVRPYYLGPDGSLDRYFALSAALAGSGRECLARWVMRKKTYVGALRLHAGYPVLVALRNAEEVVPIEDLETPAGPPLDERELDMARQLVDMLADDFDPSQYHDSYRERVEDLIETKRRGGRVREAPPPPRRPQEDLTRALEASLKQGRRDA